MKGTTKEIIPGSTTSCIFALCWKYTDGTMGCGLEGTNKDCHWCQAYLEHRQIIKEEQLKSTFIGYCKHNDMPDEISTVSILKKENGDFYCFEVDIYNFSSLSLAVEEGWELNFDWKKEEVNVAKTYYTKCGRQFKKSTHAAVTGYHISTYFDFPKAAIESEEKNSQEAQQCAICPFRNQVKKGYPGTFVRWECRAGSKPPNNKNEWIGSLDDKLTLNIYSLDHDFMESVLAYCEAEEHLMAGYNQDNEDCRRVLSVGCSQNKKGIAAKKELVERFFSELAERTDEMERQLDEYITNIKRRSDNVRDDLVAIGVDFIRINNDNLYRVKGYNSLVEFAEKEIGFKKSLLYYTMTVAVKFTKTDTYEIKEEYKDFSFSQLTEISSMPDDKYDLFTPDMTVKQIREVKKQIKDGDMEKDKPIVENGDNDTSEFPIERQIQEDENNEVEIQDKELYENESNEGRNLNNCIDSKMDNMIQQLQREIEIMEDKLKIYEDEKNLFYELVHEIDRRFDKISKTQIKNCLWDFLSTGAINFSEN